MRKFAILINVLIVLSLLISACAQATPTQAPVVEATKAPVVEATKAPEATDTPAPPASKYNESPMLADKVAAGELPPVDQRLPENPRVVKALTSEQGVYGGEMRIGFVGNSPEWGGLLFICAWEHLVSWKADFSGVEPNIAEKIEASADVKEYTIYLRKGMKWSDGEPFTADDIMFYIDDVMFNIDLNPGGPSADWLPADQRDGFKAEKVDDYTVKLIFPKPYGTFLYVLAQWQGRTFAMYPKHYLTQFHKAYNDKVDDLVAKDGSVADWKALFFKFGPDTWGNPGRMYEYVDYPVLYPWKTTQPLGTGTQVKMERNPYYFKVDEQGNQLPYVDTILATSYQDAESRTLAMLNGDLDAVKDPGNENRVIYHDAVDEGKPIKIYYQKSDAGNVNSIHFNQTISDTVKAEVFASKDFRIGMSYAINRQEIIDIVFSGQGTPAQVAPLDDSPLYNEQLTTQYIEYDPAKATEYLDKVFTNGKDADGYYLDANGNRFQIIFTVQNDLSYGTTYVQTAELLIGYWDKVGVKVLLNSMPGPQYEENKKNNRIEAIIFTGEGGAGITGILDPRYYAPYAYQGYFSGAWHYWYVKDTSGAVIVEPPQWAKDAYAKYEEVLIQPTQEQQIEKMKAVIAEAADRFYVIGIARPATMFYPYSARLGGMPDSWYDGWAEGVEKITYPEQWFLKP